MEKYHRKKQWLFVTLVTSLVFCCSMYHSKYRSMIININTTPTSIPHRLGWHSIGSHKFTNYDRQEEDKVMLHWSTASSHFFRWMFCIQSFFCWIINVNPRRGSRKLASLIKKKKTRSIVPVVVSLLCKKILSLRCSTNHTQFSNKSSVFASSLFSQLLFHTNDSVFDWITTFLHSYSYTETEPPNNLAKQGPKSNLSRFDRLHNPTTTA